MGRFNALLLLVFAFGLMSSASMAKAPSRAHAPIAAAPKTSQIESPVAAPPTSAPSQVSKTPSPVSSATAHTPTSSPSAEGPGTNFPPSSGAEETATFEKIMAIFGATFAGGAAVLL